MPNIVVQKPSQLYPLVEAFAGDEALRQFRRTLQCAPQHRISIPPDLAICAECAREITDPSNRRFAYPFTNCTHCGPRFTIANDVPYDRAATTMGTFRLCGECAREYGDPADRERCDLAMMRRKLSLQSEMRRLES